MATVHPGPGEDISTVAATLLGLAGDPRDVVFVPEDAAFSVPDDLADRYIQHGQPEPDTTTPKPADQPEPPRKRAPRGKAGARRTEEE